MVSPLGAPGRFPAGDGWRQNRLDIRSDAGLKVLSYFDSCHFDERSEEKSFSLGKSAE